MRRVLFFVINIFWISCFCQDNEIYEIYNGKGEKVRYGEMLKELVRSNVVLFGEIHNCPVSHWMEKRVCVDLYGEKKDKFVFGAEMFESDNQLIMDEYMRGLIGQERFEGEVRLWSNYSDYSFFVDFAKERKIRFVATNIPRRYARVVSEIGLEEFDKKIEEEGRRYIAPMPIGFDEKESMVEVFGKMTDHKERVVKMAESQAIKDATMAWFIYKNGEGNFVFHINGNYHSDKKGIPHYLKKYSPKAVVKTIVTIRQDKLGKIEEMDYEGVDFVILVREDFPYGG